MHCWRVWFTKHHAYVPGCPNIWPVQRCASDNTVPILCDPLGLKRSKSLLESERVPGTGHKSKMELKLSHVRRRMSFGDGPNAALESMVYQTPNSVSCLDLCRTHRVWRRTL